MKQLSDIVEKHSDVNVSGTFVVFVNIRIPISVTYNFFFQKDSLDLFGIVGNTCIFCVSKASMV